MSETLGVITFGSSPDVTKFLNTGDPTSVQFNVPFSGAHINKLGHDEAGFYSGQQLDKQTTPVLDSRIGKIAETIIGAIAGLFVTSGLAQSATIGTSAASVGPEGIPILTDAAGYSAVSVTVNPLTGFAEAGIGILPSAVEGGALPLSFAQTASNAGVSGLANTAKAYGLGNISQGVVQLFGKYGQSFLELLSGNLAGAIRVFTNNPTQGGSGGVIQYVGSGGGGGGGALSGNATSSSSLSPFILIGGAALLVFVIVWFVRKR